MDSSSAANGLRPGPISQLELDRQLKPTASQMLILRKMFLTMDVPEHERKIPENRFDAHEMIRSFTARCFEKREHIHQEQLKEIRPTARQLDDIIQAFEDLRVPDSNRVTPFTRAQAKNLQKRLGNKLDEREREYKISVAEEQKHEASPELYPEPAMRRPKPPGKK